MDLEEKVKGFQNVEDQNKKIHTEYWIHDNLCP